MLPPGIVAENLIAANNSVQIFSDSKVLKPNSEFLNDKVDNETVLSIYKEMLKIRRFEEKVGQLYLSLIHI